MVLLHVEHMMREMLQVLQVLQVLLGLSYFLTLHVC